MAESTTARPPETSLIPVIGSGQRRSVKVTALGGGHGLSSSLSALKLVTGSLTAVVTVADDGGSSGLLRQEMDVVPPGDLRMALSALCDDTDWGRTWRDAMQHRFSSSKEGVPSSLENHALGNLLIVTLWQLLDDCVAGLDWAGALLNARGRVLPMAEIPMVIEGEVLSVDGDGQPVRETVRGQAKLAKAGTIENVCLLPENTEPCAEAVRAVEEADWLVLGPGSFYTSLLPHLLLPGLRDSIMQTSAQICLVMNLDLNANETRGMTAAEHLLVLREYAPEIRVNTVISDPSTVQDKKVFEDAASAVGAKVLWASVSESDQPGVHDPLKLAAAYKQVFKH
ncbi:uridine diphosphate-N-acetylglucosamine-binding protein YvcK [Rothia sp. (in: high G+C Gram-positive bacteria)]|uniref:gluconeogenesis factor YvcK family protein n=1 Tax=Rothia sp. (in: high G+C Gram-positive bacteria) TaxID=1885016 RepID=UPI000EE3B141|nr:2-phospho-L-lactate transferase [Rothia sp. (in: high G+C Gram-positive bacteria)]